MNVVLASNNTGKLREFKKLLSPLSIQLISQSELQIPEMAETGLTFVENALLKARWATKLSGLPALADDSGIVVRALHGIPGIYSARYAGEKASAQDNIQKLLQALQNTPDDHRQAYFYCVLVFMQHTHDPTPLICEGKWTGTILHAPRGENGFGYDPIFYVSSEQKTAAELSLEQKNKISHRGIALSALLNKLSEIL